MALLAWYGLTRQVSFWSILISLGFNVINFFLVYSDGKNWFYSVPIFTASMLYTLVLSYEVKLLSEVLDFASVFPDYENQLHLSSARLTRLFHHALRELLPPHEGA